MSPKAVYVYLCTAVMPKHMFFGSMFPEHVPNQFGEFVCKLHLPEVNKCRRDKGLEELVELEDSYNPSYEGVLPEPESWPVASVLGEDEEKGEKE